MSEAENQLKICFETLNFLSSNVNTMSNILMAVVNHYGHQDPVAGKLAKEFNSEWGFAMTFGKRYLVLGVRDTV